ncbi:FecR family protein [Parapedobacter tibetensis]|uniref:FecR family protein n=1 Tax=Parapedobacter tibetensis TaxID=2972951 RepID=UPI00214DCE79|nr:FecR domain-containing protein [Parapedobacter tibetensis]
MNDQERAKELIDKYLRNACTEEERALVERFYLDQFRNQLLPTDAPSDRLKVSLWEQVSEATAGKKRKPKPLIWRWPRVAAAAALVFLAGSTLYFYVGHIKPEVQEDWIAGDVGPGGNKATLVLADGRQIELSEHQEGVIFHRNEVTYDDNTAVAVLPSGEGVLPSDLYTLSTPRGGQYRLTLPDGTGVWLNAASSITYPAAFGEGERRVELTGEAYFEVTHDTAQPFIVETAGQQVEVLGTHFNINAYPDEEVSKTTLLEGAVRVSLSESQVSRQLEPGQQANIQHEVIQVEDVVDPADAIAWKEGKFAFDEESLESILKRVARWYNVEVEYKAPQAKNIRFGGTMSRFDNMSKVLSKLEITGDVQFEMIQGKTSRILVRMKSDKR